MNESIIYTIPAPHSMHEVIEIYGEPEMGWYEYRVLDTGRVLVDTGTEGSYGRQYGQAEVALRDALMWCTDMTDGYAQEQDAARELRTVRTGLAP